MNGVNSLLDKFRAVCSLPSDSAVADRLGIKRQAVHQWRKGISFPSEDSIIRMADAIAENPERWLAFVAYDRASPNAKPYWMRIAKAAAAVLLIVSFGRLDVQTSAASFSLNQQTLYIM
jgi:transcriptional regulator with XRE-family HTH domain